MAKLIKSILANRMMFRGGGLVPPSQAAGILASSSPLIDSVTMNEGGSVNYANGGTVGPVSFPEISLGGAPQDLQITESIKSIPSAITNFANESSEAAAQRRADAAAGIERAFDFTDLTDAVSSGIGNLAEFGSEEAAAQRRGSAAQLIQAAVASGAKTFDQVVAYVARVTGESLDSAISLVQEGMQLVQEGMQDVIDIDIVGDSLTDPNRQVRVRPPPRTAVSEPPVELENFPGQDINQEIVGPPSQEALQARYDFVADPTAYAGEDPGRAATLYSGETIVPGELLRKATGWSEGITQDPYDAVLQSAGRPTSTDMATLIRGEHMKLGDKAAANLIRQTGLPPYAQDPTGIKEPVKRWYYPDRTVAENVQEAQQEIVLGAGPRRLPPYVGSGKVSPLTVSEQIEEELTPSGVGGPQSGREGSIREADERVENQQKEKIMASSRPPYTDVESLLTDAGIERPLSGYITEATVSKEITNAAQTDNQEDLKDWIKIFKEEFIDAAPEYEGASDFEKGMAWVKTGMAIAGGTSPHAIKNIADGFLSTIDEHTTDAKEKREYERQIKLSAAEYAIAANNKRRDIERGIEREGQIPIEVLVLKDMYDSEGKLTSSEGDIIHISTKEFVENPNLYGGKLAIEAAMLQMEANSDATVAQIEEANKYRENLTAEDKENFFTEADKYRELTKEAAKLLNMYTIINRSIDLSEDGNVTGLSAVVAKAVNQGFNFFNIEKGTITDETTGQRIRDPNASIYKSMAEATDEELLELANNTKEYALDDEGNVTDTEWRTADERYRNYKEQQTLWKYLRDNVAQKGQDIQEYEMNQQRLANLLIRELLGEGSKNISNIDRQLAQEIVGLYEDYAFVDPVVLQKRLMAVESNIRQNYRAATRGMRKFEETFGEYRVGPAPIGEGKDERKTVRDVYIDPERKELMTKSQVGSFGITSEEAKRNQIALDASGYTLNSDGVYVFN